MSFSVKAGTSPHQHPASSASNPAYVSPNLNASGGYRGGSSGSTHSHTNPPPFSLGDANGSENSSKRIGTDPTKYKTTICRNWEQTGSCSFRGCTFAHGVDDLRLPTRPNGTSPPLAPQQPSPSSTPPMYPQHIIAPPGDVVSGDRIEQLMESLMIEIHREREATAAQQEALKALETSRRSLRTTNVELKERVDALQSQASELARQVMERNTMILTLVDLAGPALSPEQRQRADALSTWSFASPSDVHFSQSSRHHHRDAEDAPPSVMVPAPRSAAAAAAAGSSSSSSRGNNPAAAVWVPPSPQSAPTASPSDGETENKLRSLLEVLRSA